MQEIVKKKKIIKIKKLLTITNSQCFFYSTREMNTCNK